tara:strand:- start:1653 stop:2204 length:552 start_codon:yes stop_codon:yes gene_type:complete
MEIYSLEIPEVKVIKPKKNIDNRGYFSEVYSNKSMKENGVDLNFLQDNQSLSVDINVVRGLHYQAEPFAQDKLLRCLTGSLLDVAVDLRKDSPTFGKHIKKVISAENFEQILVPIGFAHGFVTLEENTTVLYKVTNFYSPKHDFGVFWNDPELGIDWGIDVSKAIVSEKDQKQPHFKDLKNLF